jgi:hypothetical protein
MRGVNSSHTAELLKQIGQRVTVTSESVGGGSVTSRLQKLQCQRFGGGGE